MWKFECSLPTKASKKTVWELWCNVEKWPEWDTEIFEAALLEELKVDVEGKMKVHDNALISFTVTELIPEERFAICTKMFGARAHFIYEMLEEEKGLRVTHRVEIRGILGWLWGWTVGRRIKKTHPVALEKFVALAEAQPASVQKQAPVENSDATSVEQGEQPSMASAEPVADVQPSDESSETSQVQTERGSEETTGVSDASSEASAYAASQEEKSEKRSEDVQKENVSSEAATEDAKEESGGDPSENELRKKDIHEQIEQAAIVPDPELPPAPPKDEESIEKEANSSVSTPKTEESLPEEPAPEESTSASGDSKSVPQGEETSNAASTEVAEGSVPEESASISGEVSAESPSSSPEVQSKNSDTETKS